MATRGTIALEFADGTIQMVYSHWDNYLSHNGNILKDYYSDPFKLQQLIELGSISSLAPEIGVRHPFDNPHPWRTPEYYAYEDEFKNMTKFYGRDRGEEDTGPQKFVDYNDYKNNAPFQEYNYILRQVDGQPQWFVNGRFFEELAQSEFDEGDK
jgi:hypothetical protein